MNAMTARKPIAARLSECWHIATVGPRKEDIAVADMAKHGIEAYHPKKARWKTSARAKRRVESPIVPGYVFFRLNDPEDEERLEAIDGVTGFLRIGRVLAAIPPEVDDQGEVFHWVTRTREEEARGDFDTTIDRSPAIDPGMRVRILAGAFAEMIGVVVSLSGKGSVRLELEAKGHLNRYPVTIGKLDVAVEDAA